MRTFVFLLFGTLTLSGCSVTAERSDALMDSGLPLSELQTQYDVLHYTIRTEILVDDEAIVGDSTIRFAALEAMTELELNFDGGLQVTSVSRDGRALTASQSDWKLTVQLDQPLAAGDVAEVKVAYGGKPVEATRPPWNGGFVWEETPSGAPWIATAFQGEGCDVWWPCKDHPSGEPRDGVDLLITVPDSLTVASNGVLVEVENLPNARKRFHWRTDSQINTYGIALNIAPYVLIESSYTSRNGTEVPIMFWTLPENETAARELFEREFQPIIDWFEKTLGPYPWGHEKLGIAETPHLGMEHQTINAYGNGYERDEYGFDWLFHHELSHEWFGNVMTHRTVSDLWLHEGFGAYMQSLYTLDTMGEAAFYARMFPSLNRIRSCVPTAPREERSDDQLYFESDTGPGPDIYAKGLWAMHTLRMTIGDDMFWRAVRRLLYGTEQPDELPAPIRARFRSTDDFAEIVSDVVGRDMHWFFEVYFRQAALPELKITETESGVELRWITETPISFPLPVEVRVDGELRRITFEEETAVIPGATRQDLVVDPFLSTLRYLPTVPRCSDAEGGE